MSAYVVDHKTIHRVVSYLLHDRKHSHICRELADLFNVSSDGEKEFCQRIGNEMLQLNCLAVNLRYPHHPSVAQEYKFSYELASDLQALQSLRCWMYQCSEGSIPDTSPLYKTLRELRLQWAESIIETHVPAMKHVRWE